MIPLARRSALLGLTAAVTAGRVSLALGAAPTERRFVVVILRGALDGMAAVPPYGDPDLGRLRAEIVPPPPGQPDGMLRLDGFFALHPALTGLADRYSAGELLVVHAVAGPYRSRSHFEAQDYLESGADHRLTSGWLNRALQAMPKRTGAAASDALAIGVTLPLLLRGPAEVANWAPTGFAAPSPDLYARIESLNAGDKLLGPAISEGLRQRGLSASVMAGTEQPRDRNAFPALAADAGRLLAAENGPRVAALEIGGWDTHADQKGRLVSPLKQLDAGLVALKSALGPAWNQTVVLVMTEFGRTARVNGTRGTDHGTGTVALVLGGAVAGGRVLADWPGLADAKLLEARDLRPTLDLRSVAKGLLADHLGLGAPGLASAFPDSAAAAPAKGLIRA